MFATAGSDEKCRACEALGAERAINYRTQDFVEVVRELTGGRGVDLILDIVGGSYVPRNLAALAIDGRLVQIGLMERRVDGAGRFAPRARPPADDHRFDAAAADAWKRRGRSPRALAARGLAAARSAASSSRSSTGRFRWPRPPPRTG